MSNSIDDIAKSRTRPTQTGEPVLVRLQPDLIGKLDSWRADQRPIPSRPEALRMILKEWLAGRSAT